MRHKVLRPLLAVVLALGLSSTLSPTSAAQPSITTGPDDSASARANAEQEAIDNAAQAAATPAAGREDLEPAEPGFDDNTIDNDAGADWHATTNPEAMITPGQMRSDTEDIPGGFTKEEADRAEVQEAAEQQAEQDRAANPLARALAAAPINCTTYWPSPYKVCGAIREKYDAIGGPTSFLTWPKSDELGVPDGVGRRNEFVNGFIYWHPTTGAHPVTTHFSTVWARNGWEAGRLGYPTTDELGLSDGIGRKQSFQRGHIYGSLAGLASIEGLIYDKWVATGAEGGPLGYPTADEAGTPDGIGRYNHFIGGDIYWHPEYGAHPISGTILLRWDSLGRESGAYGYPVSDAIPTTSIWYDQTFTGGTLTGAPISKDLYWPIGNSTNSNARAKAEVDGPAENYEDRVLGCVDYEVSGDTKLALFNVHGKGSVLLYCERFRNHIVSVANPGSGHFNEVPPTRSDYYDFLACVNYTLNAEDFDNAHGNNWGRQRGNKKSGVNSVAIVNPNGGPSGTENELWTAWAGYDEYSGNWHGCVDGLEVLWK